MSLPAASFEPVISYLNLASPGAEIRSGKIGNSASLWRSGHTTIQGEQTWLPRPSWVSLPLPLAGRFNLIDFVFICWGIVFGQGCWVQGNIE